MYLLIVTTNIIIPSTSSSIKSVVEKTRYNISETILITNAKQSNIFEKKQLKYASFKAAYLNNISNNMHKLMSNSTKKNKRLKLSFLLYMSSTICQIKMDEFMREAYNEALAGYNEGGIPIGSVLVKNGKIIGRGHNRRVQKSSSILHAEMDCFENAGRLKASDYKDCVLYSTLSPCDMCSGTSLLYKIPKIIVGENKTFQGPEAYVRSRGVVLEILNLPECIQLMEKFIQEKPQLWNEEIGT